MSNVLTMSSTVLCDQGPHAGIVEIDSSAKLCVAGSSVLTKESVNGKTVTACKIQVSNTTQPCVEVESILGSETSKLTVGGKPVLLETLVGKTDGKPIGNLNATANQTKLTAI